MTSSASGQAPVSILIVDDSPNNLKSLAALLARPDYELIQASSGSEALAAVLRHDFALILLDVAMPGMDGLETAKLIKQREQSKRIPIIFITAYVYDIEHVLRGYTAGAVDYLRKPIDPHQLKSKVAVFVELYQQRQQIERQAMCLREAELREQRLLRSRAEEALKDSEALYQYTFEQAPIGIGHATLDGIWTKANPRLCEILGHARESLLGRKISDLVSGPAGLEIATAIERLGSHEAELYTAEHELRTALGTPMWGHLTIRPSYRDGDRPRHLIVVLDDVGARKRIELERVQLLAELRQGICARNDFLSIAAHELKTPITPLRLQAANLRRELQRGGESCVASATLPRVETIERSVIRIEGLIDNLLAFSRLNVGRPGLEVEEVDLVALAREVVARFSAQAQHSGSEIGLHAPHALAGRWDRLRLDQVLTNLVSNAIKYGDGKPIEVIIARFGEQTRLSVVDHGIGIPADAQERIFERFERLGPTRHYGGFGLGLWIARELVEAHGGRISVRSHPGEGSEFQCELPNEVPDHLAGGERTRPIPLDSSGVRV